MDSQFWLGVILTVIVGIPVTYGIAIVAHFHAPRLKHFLDSRRLLKTHRTQQQALQRFYLIKEFREGKRDRYAAYIIAASASVVCVIIAATLNLIAVVQPEFPLAILLDIPVVLAVLACMLALVFLISIYDTARQIERFDDYKEEVEKRWGPIDEEEKQA